MSNEESVVSKSRTYVAICNTINFDGHYCRQFILPDDYINDASMASWYFLNKVDQVSCIELVLTSEDYHDYKIVY